MQTVGGQTGTHFVRLPHSLIFSEEIMEIVKNPFRFVGGNLDIMLPDATGVKSEINKFALYLVNNKKEIHVMAAKSQGLVDQRTVAGLDRTPFDYNIEGLYESPITVVKLFNYCKSPDMPPFFYSFYIQLGDTGKELTIYPFSDKLRERQPNWYFRAEGRFLRKEEIRQILNPADISYKFAERQGTPLTALLQKMIVVKEVKNVRKAQEEVSSVRGGKRIVRIRE
jgi:hypothetical protein